MEDKLTLLARLLTEHGLTRISLEEKDLKICLEKELPIVMTGAAPAPAAVAAPAPTVAEASAPAEEAESIKAPLAGIYYGKPSPEARSFVREGQKVKAGETLCIIESMKIMNEIKAPSDLTILKILKRDEQVAEYNEPLFLVTK
ncbi:acetyl-CoA carboxylase, biotin carboxyl carrier protein [Clostridiaceae bacterium HFYG-1003]|nr:acetyl-CoA carboxylase, biotin carboxyl carrier protein [Clostridiaceae bacterium HFYG-1003]